MAACTSAIVIDIAIVSGQSSIHILKQIVVKSISNSMDLYMSAYETHMHANITHKKRELYMIC